MVSPPSLRLSSSSLSTFGFSRSPSSDLDQPNYRPGRFHAHVLASPVAGPSNSSTSGGGGRTLGGTETPLSPSPLVTTTKRERLKHVGGGAKRFFQRKKQQDGKVPGTTEERERLLNDFNSPRPSSSHTNGRRLFVDPPVPRRIGGGTGIEGIREETEEEEDEEDDSREITWLLLRPGKKRVKRWMASWWKRWALLVLLPCCIVSAFDLVCLFRDQKKENPSILFAFLSQGLVLV